MLEDAHILESVPACLARILRSQHFSRSQALSRFLQFVVELTLNDKEQELKEYRLGVEVFGRGADFDPRVDPIVRIQAAKLRARLAEYYASDGKSEAIILSIPKGGYVPTFTYAEPPISAPAQPSSPEIQSIAVLPFVSMSGDPENEYFSDGLTEELINVLAYVPGLRVVARTSVFCFKRAVRDVREIGSQLNVQTVLEGSVRKAGNQLRVTAQLIDVATGYHLASKTYTRELKDVFSLQEELAQTVVAEIMPRTRSAKSVVRTHATNLDAYNLYLKGMFALSNRFTGPRESIAMFRSALEQDPHYAPAWAGLAHSHFSLAWFSIMRPNEAMPHGKEAALRALELDDTLGQAYAALAMIQAAFEWDWQESERNFLRAIQFQPSLSLAHHFYAILCLQPQGRYNEAVSWIERALLLNPYDAILSATATLVYVIAGDYEAAVRRHELSVEVNPHYPLAYTTMGIGHETQGRYDEAVAMHRKAVASAARAPIPISCLAHALAKSGRRNEAEQLLQELLNAPQQSGFALAITYEGLGNRQQAVRWMKHAGEQREPQCIIMPVDPRLADLRRAPEMCQLLRGMGLARAATV